MFEPIRQYSVPLVLALAMHLLAGAALYANWNPREPETRIIEPQIVMAELVVLEPKPKPSAPKPELPAPQPPAEKPKPEPEPEPKPEPEPEVVESEPKPDLERERQEERARQERLEALARAAFQDALENEAEQLAAVEASEDEAVAQSFRNGIYLAVVGNWSRPPSARNGMQAKLLVELVPTGHLISVTLLDSSGNAAFDRSAEAAVRKAAPFEVPRESDIFEAHFRRFTLLFRPEDLLR